MNVDQLISELLLREDRRQEVKVVLPDGNILAIRDTVDSKTPRTVDDYDKEPEMGPVQPFTLIRLEA